MPYQELAQPAPTVGVAKAEAPQESKSVKVEAAHIAKEPHIKAAPTVSEAVVGDYQKFAPKIPPEKASILSVDELKKYGSEFESEAGVIKGCVKKDMLKKVLPFFFDERDFVSYGEVRRYIFLRRNCIFVYGEKSDPSPLYVIEIERFRAEIEDPRKPDKHSFSISPQAGSKTASGSCYTTVLLKDKYTGKQEYQITFDTEKDKSLTKRFMDALSINAKRYGGEVINASVVDSKSEKK